MHTSKFIHTYAYVYVYFSNLFVFNLASFKNDKKLELPKKIQLNSKTRDEHELNIVGVK